MVLSPRKFSAKQVSQLMTGTQKYFPHSVPDSDPDVDADAEADDYATTAAYDSDDSD